MVLPRQDVFDAASLFCYSLLELQKYQALVRNSRTTRRHQKHHPIPSSKPESSTTQKTNSLAVVLFLCLFFLGQYSTHHKVHIMDMVARVHFDAI